MKKPGKGKEKKKIGYNYLGMAGIAVIALVLLGSLMDEYVEEAAREKLGLVKDNEIVFQEEN